MNTNEPPKTVRKIQDVEIAHNLGYTSLSSIDLDKLETQLETIRANLKRYLIEQINRFVCADKTNIAMQRPCTIGIDSSEYYKAMSTPFMFGTIKPMEFHLRGLPTLEALYGFYQTLQQSNIKVLQQTFKQWMKQYKNITI